VAAALVATAVLVGFSFVWFGNSGAHDLGLRAQQADACAVERLVGPGAGLYSLGDPIPLVMTQRGNPDRYLYLGEGVADWKIRHTPGGFFGWTHEIRDDDPKVLVLDQWTGYAEKRMERWLGLHDYYPSYAGAWKLYLRPAMLRHELSRGVELTGGPTPYAAGPHGDELPASGC
jgi:hypothetical protein